MSYQVPPTPISALTWLFNTLVVLPSNPLTSSLSEIMSLLDNHNTHPSDGHAKLYILIHPESTRTSLLLNASHALLDVFSSGVIWQTLLDEFALVKEGETAESVMQGFEWGKEVANLPRPIANVLGEAFPQTWFEWAKTIWRALKALGNVKADSIRPPLHPEHASRPLGTASHTHVFAPEETTRFVKRCKAAGTTVTYAYIAILALALQDLYGPTESTSGKKKEQFQVFAMPYNGRRWLPAGLSPVPPHSPSLGNTTAYIKIAHSGPALRSASSSHSHSPSSSTEDVKRDNGEGQLRAERVRRILEFGARYKESSTTILNSPTPDGVLASRTLAPLLVRAMEGADPSKPAGALFGVVSQGQLDKMFPQKANVDGSDVVVTDYRNGGRTVDNNPLMILYTWRGQMHARFKWNSKYFDDQTFKDIDAKVVEYMEDFVRAE